MLQIIHPVRKDEIDALVVIHTSAFPEFFLTQLGRRFLRLYYSSVLSHPEGILLGYYEEDRLTGFCAATINSNGFNKRLIKFHFFAFVIETFILLLTNIKALKRLYLNLSKSDSANTDKGEYAELLSIGVDREHQGKGIGKQLLMALEEEVKQRGGRKLSLTTDCHNNKQAVSFYRSMGYRVFYDFMAYPDREMYRLIKTLS
ncbi:GNAT family N-acetyltransferase [Bacteroides salyersiae]|jgi:ribosomal protein S18 acetylase RimI-like enzyme|uniref:GNAT family N-acetyltransferase n=1 Tax=Bacteroides salyersiae TaxID=291644 RepID=UPI001C8C7984|nr:GNAT family N-acetyltransferase [Bacteroides salyersiae]